MWMDWDRLEQIRSNWRESIITSCYLSLKTLLSVWGVWGSGRLLLWACPLWTQHTASAAGRYGSWAGSHWASCWGDSLSGRPVWPAAPCSPPSSSRPGSQGHRSPPTPHTSTPLAGFSGLAWNPGMRISEDSPALIPRLDVLSMLKPPSPMLHVEGFGCCQKPPYQWFFQTEGGQILLLWVSGYNHGLSTEGKSMST